MIVLKVCGANGAGHSLSLWFLLDAHSLVVNIVKKRKEKEHTHALYTLSTPWPVEVLM